MSTQIKRKLSEEDEGNQTSSKKLAKQENLEENISKLLNAVISGDRLGPLVVIMHSDTEHPYVTLQNSLACLNGTLVVTREAPNSDVFILQINGETYAREPCQNTQLAKRILAEEVLEKLKETCFFIKKKIGFVNVTKENLQASTSSTNANIAAETSSVAHKIMAKMGWTGGGLGAQEQGNIDSVTLYENVNRQGLGSNNLMKEITKKLESFSRSSDVLTLVFNEEFTKEERALIHRVARKFNLKSRSTGNETRKLSVSKKITRIDIVRELLKLGGEDGLYTLEIPRKFVHLWK